MHTITFTISRNSSPKVLGVCRQSNALSTYSNDANRNTDHNTVKSRKSYIPTTKKKARMI